MGQSIVDYTEGNPMENYTFVFSTGAYIDSLFVRGSVIDAFTGEPKENIIVSLYDDLRDSSIYNSQPLYFTRTNKEGEFEIRNIKKDSFTVFALDDKNLNYYKDQESEGMGFYGDTIELDTAFITPLKLQFFNPDPSLRMTNKMHLYGFLKLVFNRDPFDVNFTYSREPEYFQTLVVKDSMYVWYQNVDSTELYVNLNSDKTDTVNLIVYNDTLKYSKKLKIQKINASNRVALPPLDTLLITFNHPVVDADVSKIILKDTSPINLKLSIQLDSLAKNNLKLIHKWKEGQKYELHFLDSAFMDHLGNTSDTINLQFVTGNNSSLGEIIFELDSLNKSYNYIVELVKGNEILKKYVKNSTQAKIVFSSLSSGNYTTRIYEDRNKNDRWDPGNYNLKQQSEKWISKKLESLKAGWTLEVSVNGKEFK